MRTETVKGIAGLVAAVQRDAGRWKRGAVRATVLAAHDTLQYVATQTIPIAFGELRASLRVDLIGNSEVRLVADAPHAAAVEVGSRPHTPPLAPLIKWVKLRGMQGLQKGPLRGRTSREHATGIAAALRAMRVFSPREMNSIKRAVRTATLKARRQGKDPAEAALGAHERRSRNMGSTPVDAPEKIARAIQQAIAKHGTKPHRYMARAMPHMRAKLAERMRDFDKE